MESDFLTLSSALRSFEGSVNSISPRSFHVTSLRKPSGLQRPIPNGVLRVLYRLQYKKLRRLLRVSTEYLDLKLLARLAPSASMLLTDRTVKLCVRFRLDGRCWPPLLVYQAEVLGAKKVALRHGSTLRTRQLWRTLVTDKPMQAPLRLPRLHPSRPGRRREQPEWRAAYQRHWTAQYYVRLGWRSGVPTNSFLL